MKIKPNQITTTIFNITIVIYLIAGVLIGIIGKGCCTPVSPEIILDSIPPITDSLIIPDTTMLHENDSIKEVIGIFPIDSNSSFKIIHSFTDDNPRGTLTGYLTRHDWEVTPTINYPVSKSQCCLNTFKAHTITALVTTIVVTAVVVYFTTKYNIIK